MCLGLLSTMFCACNLLMNANDSDCANEEDHEHDAKNSTSIEDDEARKCKANNPHLLKMLRYANAK